MGASFTITTETDTYEFIFLASDQGMYALESPVASPRYDFGVFHPAGIDGNYLVRKGRIGRLVICRMRYIDLYPDLLSIIAAQQDDWANLPASIEDEAGLSYDRCRLQPDGMRRITPIRPMGRGDDNCFVDVEASFISDA